MCNEVIVPAVRQCDVCKQLGTSKRAEYDAKTVMGPWANLCQRCFDEFGIGLGTGKGQRLIVAGG